jgi:PAS domain S-box-containing protein
MGLFVKAGSLSVRRKLLLPLLTISIVVAAIAVWGIYASAEQQLLERLRHRAELVAHAVNYAAENVSRGSDLERIVSAIGAEREVGLIVVAGGKPARVLAATRNAWLGEVVTDLRDVGVARGLNSALQAHAESGHLNRKGGYFEFSSPLLISRTDLARQALSQGTVLVRLGVGSTYAEIRQSTRRFAAAFLAIVAGLTAIGYLQLNAHVLQPIAALGRYIKDPASAGAQVCSPQNCNDEFGELGRTLHDALTRTDAAVRELERQKMEYQVLFDLVPAMIWFKDTNNGFLRVNQRVAEATGLAIAQIEGKSADEIFPQEAARYYADDLEVIRSGKPKMGIVEKLRGPDGRELWVLTDKVPCCDRDGKVIGLLAMVHDITERKRAEHVTVRTLQRLNDAQALGKMGDWEWDIATQAITWSPQVFEIIGRDPSLGPPRDYEEVAASYDAPSRALLQENITRAIETGEAQEYELVVLRPNGERVQIQAVAMPRKGESGQVVGLYGTIQNISDRKRSEAALRTSEQRYHALFENMLEGYAYCRTHFDGDELRDFTYLEVNGAFEKLTGLQQVVGRKLSELVPGIQQTNRESFEVYSRVALTGQAEKFETYAAGFDIWLSITVYSSGRDSFVAVFDNITDRKQAEFRIADSKRQIEQLNADLEKRVVQRTEEFLAATAEAERANRAKSEFLSRTSHELRTPLNAILGFGQLLELEENFEAESRESVEQILHAGRHLLSLVNEVLDISNAESGVMTLASESVPVDQLITETLSLVVPLQSTLQVEVKRASPLGGGWEVLADPQRLKQVLLNLLSNAIKYNRPGGKVIVEFAPIAETDRPAFRFSVQDTGPGISPEKRPRLFTPFDRLDAERTHIHIAGTGLGLALAKRTVELMGGRIGVESVVGEGSTFWVEVPLAKSAVLSLDQRAPIADPASDFVHSRKLLYIEDNVSNLRLVTRILARRPAIQLLSAVTGTLGLELAFEHRPELILLDLNLPDLNGDQVLSVLRADPRTSDIPVVMLTADNRPATRERILAACARAFLAKPVEVRALLRVFDQLFKVQPEADGRVTGATGKFC